jgi:flavin reductase (DIM6/NTAB) family NADH-FMN oxidoreductase RutF
MSWKEVNPTKIHRLFYPQVPVVITAAFNGRIGGMPAIWHSPLSFDPPLVGVAIAPEHKTYEMIVGSNAFGLNWLDFSYARQVGELGESSGKDYVNKLSVVGFGTVKGSGSDQPLIAESSAALECLLSERHRMGTHELFIGRVVAAWASQSFGDYWDHARYNALLYVGTEDGKGKSWVFRSLRDERVVVPLHQKS